MSVCVHPQVTYPPSTYSKRKSPLNVVVLCWFYWTLWISEAQRSTALVFVTILECDGFTAE